MTPKQICAIAKEAIRLNKNIDTRELVGPHNQKLENVDFDFEFYVDIPGLGTEDIEHTRFTANNIKDIAEGYLRMAKALDKCLKQRDYCFANYMYHVNPPTAEEIEKMKSEDNVELEAILNGEEK